MSSGDNVFPIGKLTGELAKVKKELAWYKAFCDQVQQSDHRAYEYACEYANEVTGVIEYPYDEGDSYWTIKPMDENATYEDNISFFQRGVVAIQSCWDDVSEELHTEDKEYFDSLEEVLQDCRFTYDFVKVECFDCDMSDIANGDYLVCDDEDSGKFQKSY